MVDDLFDWDLSNNDLIENYDHQLNQSQPETISQTQNEKCELRHQPESKERLRRNQQTDPPDVSGNKVNVSKEALKACDLKGGPANSTNRNKGSKSEMIRKGKYNKSMKEYV